MNTSIHKARFTLNERSPLCVSGFTRVHLSFIIELPV